MDGDVPNIRLIRDRVVYANRFGQLYDDDVEFHPSAQRGRYLRWRWRAEYSVAVLALAQPDTALLVRNFRHSARRTVLEAVKGFGDDARDAAEVARAELSEEIGFIATNLEYIGTIFTDSSFAHHPMKCFIAEGEIGRTAMPESSEAIVGPERFSLSRTPDALASGEVQDSVTLALLWQAFNRSQAS
jgi:8-oxo-dGTP pyrophosphatase MutT (NUDIX family)